jgi:MFS family permease
VAAPAPISGPVVPPERGRLVTGRFVLVVSAGLLYFFSLGMLLPVVPLYVEGPLGSGKLAVGIAVGAFSAGAILLRPVAGMIGDRHGRRILIIGGAVIVAASLALYHLASGVAAFVAFRLLGGVGEAAFFVGAGTMVTDLAPEDRRGEAISYWSVAVYGGLALGPWLGEGLACDGAERSCADGRFGVVWTTGAAMALAAGAIGLFTEESAGAPELEADRGRARLLHPAAILPGTVLFLGLIGLAGYTSFVALYVREIGMADSRGVLALYALVILVVRIVGARVPDRIGPVRAATLATVTGAAGLVVIAAADSPGGLYVGTAVFALGMSLLYPAMMTLALVGLPANERGSAVGTISSFFDLSQGLGAAVLGGVADLTGYRGGFLTAAGLTVVGLVVLRVGTGRRQVDELVVGTA